MIGITELEYREIQDILKRFPYSFYALGSRVKGNYGKFSDLDLITTEDISDVEKADIKELFDESNLPFEVDIIVRKSIFDGFFKGIEPDLVKIK